MTLDLPEFCLVVLVGVSGAGKTTFARQHFSPTQVVSSDACRGLVSDDETDQSATTDAFEVLHAIVDKRLARARLTVVDATSVQRQARRSLVELARRHDCPAVAVVLDVPSELAARRNEGRSDRNFGPHVIEGQHCHLQSTLPFLKREGFSRVYVLESVEAIDTATIRLRKPWNDKRHQHGPFDIIGDVHGCSAELRELLERLGYGIEGTRDEPVITPPHGRKAIFVGDLVDRGPDSPGVLRLVMSMVRAGAALCVSGNHEFKLLNKLRGKNVRLTHGLAETMQQLDSEPQQFVRDATRFIARLESHYVLDEGRLVVAHAGLREELQGRTSGRVRSFCLFGEATGKTDEFGLPTRYDWARDYRGRAMVVYGHTPTADAQWVNRTICIDTGCVFGGKLTALRYPEHEIVSVPAAMTYYAPARPFAPRVEAAGEQQHVDAVRPPNLPAR